MGDHSTKDSLRFDRALQALGESTHSTKDEVFARKMAAYARLNNVASKCPTHSNSAPPLVAVKKGKSDWLSDSAVRSALRLKKVGLTGLITSVRGEPDIHSAVGTLPHEAAPLLDQMPKNEPLSKLTPPPHTGKTRRGNCIWVT